MRTHEVRGGEKMRTLKTVLRFTVKRVWLDEQN